jgi:8-oxo-dGTP pyrophosphatase MutT (NUDIX family)
VKRPCGEGSIALPEERDTTYSVAGGVVIEDGRALLLEIRGRGEFRLPKGRVRSGESREQAALREVIEETGYASPVSSACLGSVWNHFLIEGRLIQRHETYFLMQLEDHKQARRDAHDEAKFAVRWVALDEAVALLTYESEKEFMRQGVAYARLGAACQPTPEREGERPRE